MLTTHTPQAPKGKKRVDRTAQYRVRLTRDEAAMLYRMGGGSVTLGAEQVLRGFLCARRAGLLRGGSGGGETTG